MSRTREQINAIALVGDRNWRRGLRIRPLLAWAFGRRELIATSLGDILVVCWWRQEPYLVDILCKPKGQL